MAAIIQDMDKEYRTAHARKRAEILRYLDHVVEVTGWSPERIAERAREHGASLNASTITRFKKKKNAPLWSLTTIAAIEVATGVSYCVFATSTDRPEIATLFDTLPKDDQSALLSLAQRLAAAAKAVPQGPPHALSNEGRRSKIS